MSSGESRGDGLWDKLQDAYDTYLAHSFREDPPDRPLIDHWKAKG